MAETLIAFAIKELALTSVRQEARPEGIWAGDVRLWALTSSIKLASFGAHGYADTAPQAKQDTLTTDGK